MNQILQKNQIHFCIAGNVFTMLIKPYDKFICIKYKIL